MSRNRAGISVFDTQSRIATANQYKASMNLPDKVNCGDVFNTYRESRVASLTGFGDIKLPGGKTLESKLNADSTDKAAVTALNNQITTSLQVDGKLREFQATYEDNIAAIGRIMKKPNGSSFSVEAIAGKIQNLKSDSVKALEAQQKHESGLFEAMVKNPAFLNNLKAVTGATDDQAGKIVKDMQEQLKKAHADQKAQMDKAFSDEVKRLHDEADRQRRRVAYFGTFVKHAKTLEIRDEILKKAEAKMASTSQATTVQINVEDKNTQAIFKNLEIKDLDFIQSISGNKIEKTADGYQMKMPAWGMYYHGSDDKIAYDFTTMAATIKAANAPTIEMTVNYPQDPEYAMELGRKAAEACVFAGYSMDEPPDAKDPKDQKKAEITIIVNGQRKKLDELFAGHPQQLGQLKADAKRLMDERTAAHGKPANTQEVKKLDQEIAQETKRFKDAAAGNRAVEQAAEQQNTSRPGAP
ncbi:hypothetical protein ACFORL_12380 [Legionella dresdenensis]|uniref:Coiled coil domain-containing protein n=1 Tax=Legionella dresdenensis TaxID=450200 RepID=A0ABV8CHT9_9GAMM